MSISETHKISEIKAQMKDTSKEGRKKKRLWVERRIRDLVRAEMQAFEEVEECRKSILSEKRKRQWLNASRLQKAFNTKKKQLLHARSTCAIWQRAFGKRLTKEQEREYYRERSCYCSMSWSREGLLPCP